MAVSQLRTYRSFCDRLTQAAWSRATPLYSGNALRPLRTAGAVLRLPGNHSASRPIGHQGRSVLSRPACTLQGAPRLRPPIVCCRKQHVGDFIVHYYLVHCTFTLDALALIPGPSPNGRGEPAPASGLIFWPPRQTSGGTNTVPLAGVGG